MLCVACGARIGVYEPAVFVDGAVATRTSRAAMPAIEKAPDHAAFHVACYDARGGAGA